MFEQILAAIDVTSNESNVLDAAQDLANLTSGTVPFRQRRSCGR